MAATINRNEAWRAVTQKKNAAYRHLVGATVSAAKSSDLLIFNSDIRNWNSLGVVDFEKLIELLVVAKLLFENSQSLFAAGSAPLCVIKFL